MNIAAVCYRNYHRKEIVVNVDKSRIFKGSIVESKINATKGPFIIRQDDKWSDKCETRSQVSPRFTGRTLILSRPSRSLQKASRGSYLCRIKQTEMLLFQFGNGPSSVKEGPLYQLICDNKDAYMSDLRNPGMPTLCYHLLSIFQKYFVNELGHSTCTFDFGFCDLVRRLSVCVLFGTSQTDDVCASKGPSRKSVHIVSRRRTCKCTAIGSSHSILEQFCKNFSWNVVSCKEKLHRRAFWPIAAESSHIKGTHSILYSKYVEFAVWIFYSRHSQKYEKFVFQSRRLLESEGILGPAQIRKRARPFCDWNSQDRWWNFAKFHRTRFVLERTLVECTTSRVSHRMDTQFWCVVAVDPILMGLQ